MDLDREQCRRRFASARTALLGTISDDGSTTGMRPHLVPITFAVDGDLLITAVDHKPKRHRQLRRLANIEAHPLVSLLVDHYDEDWEHLWWVRADGSATVLPPHAVGVDWLRQKYPQYRERPPEGPVIQVEINRWVGWAATQ